MSVTFIHPGSAGGPPAGLGGPSKPSCFSRLQRCAARHLAHKVRDGEAAVAGRRAACAPRRRTS